MPQSNPNLPRQLSLYRQILVAEFIREFHFLADVVAGRATAKGDFTDKICQALKLVSTLGTSNIPVVSGLVDGLIDSGFAAINDKRKASKQEYIGTLHDEINPEPLRILLESVALEAARRYEFVIAAKLSDVPLKGVIPFAKVGVERMLEFIARKQLPLTEDHLLQGLIEGRSGAYVRGFQNTRLALQDLNSKEKFTAEGIYARSAFRTADGRYWTLPKNQAKHKLASSSPAKEKLYNYGYTKFIKNSQDPKYGYATVPQAMVTHYGYQPQARAAISPALTQQLHAHPPSIHTATRQDIQDYLNALKNQRDLSFHDYLAQRHPDLQLVMYRPDNAGDFDLSAFDMQGADFSECIFNHCKFAGSLADSRFKNAYLVHVDFTGVSDAQGADFSGAHLEHSNVENAKFAGANFNQAHLHFAHCQKTDFCDIQAQGTGWLGAETEDARFSNWGEIKRQQEAQ